MCCAVSSRCQKLEEAGRIRCTYGGDRTVCDASATDLLCSSACVLFVSSVFPSQNSLQTAWRIFVDTSSVLSRFLRRHKTCDENLTSVHITRQSHLIPSNLIWIELNSTELNWTTDPVRFSPVQFRLIKAIVYSRLRHRCATNKYFRFLSLSKIWLESRPLCFSCSVAADEYTRRAIGSLCENMTSSTKPEVHSISQRRQMNTDRSTATGIYYAKKMVKIGRVFFEFMRADRQTNGQTDILIAILRIPPRGQGGVVRSSEMR